MPSNVSSVVNYFSTANEGFATTLGTSILSGATTVPLASVASLTDGSVFVGIIEPGAAAQQVFTGIVSVSGVEITSVVWTRGSNVAHTGGVVIVDYVTGTDWNMMSAGILVAHNQNGTLKSSAIAPAVTTITSSATPAPNSATTTEYIVTALAVGATFTNPSGSPVQGQPLLIRIKDNATAQTLAWGTEYRALANSLPTTTVISKTLYVGFIFNSTDTKWDLVAVVQGV